MEIKDNGIVIVDFYATWCGPCQMLSPILEELKEKYKVEKVNVDEQPDLAKENGIMSIPTVFIYKDKKLINKFIGYKTKEEIERLIEM
jgi:thioredoxin 1